MNLEKMSLVELESLGFKLMQQERQLANSMNILMSAIKQKIDTEESTAEPKAEVVEKTE